MAGNDLGPCPFCGQQHDDTVLLCPTSEKLLPLEGRILDGKFRFTRMLGEGGMGAVWRAENVLVKKTVAIKLMHIQFSKDEGVLARFRNEATAAGRIGSEHICDILDLGRSQLGPYIVMEMLRGRDLAGFLQKHQGKVDPGLSVLIVRESLKGLSAAHQAGIIHRDLKPENIFLHEPKPGQLMVKLMDFGISKFTEGSEAGKTGMGVLMGTPEYMSPEQTEGAAQVNHATDIWAMGVILYWALSGRNPFLGPTMAATLVNVSTREPPPLTTLGSHIDPGLIQVIDRCLRKNPLERWGSCDELSQALLPYENHNNGIYTIAGAAASTPSGPGRTVASVGPPSTPTPPPGATVASAGSYPPAAPSGGAAPTMMGGGGPPGTGPGMHSGPSAGPTFSGGAAPTGPGNSPTWSNEFRGGEKAAPTIGGNSSFNLRDDQLDRRPDSSLGGSSKFGTIFLVLLLLGALGGGGWFAYQKFGPGSASVAASDDAGAQAVGQADDGKANDSKADEGTPAAASEGGTGGSDTAPGGTTSAAAQTGTGEAASGSAAAATGGTAAGEAGNEAGGKDDGGADDGGSTSGATPAADGGGADDGGKGDGGGTTPKPPPKKVDLSKVNKSGSSYGIKSPLSARNGAAAKSACSKLKSRKYANLRKWRLPNSAGELKRFLKGKSGKFWIAGSKYFSTKTGRVGGLARGGLPGGKVICVSS